jgi:hypothetical protein
MRRHTLALLLLPLLLIVGCGGHTPASTPVAPTPTTNCTAPPGHGSMGSTLRCRLGAPLLHLTAPTGQTGIDLSNNDPSYGQWATIRRHASFVYLKVSEGTGFTDGTAARMAHEARTAGLLVGGYDFMHVCGDSPTDEARVFISAARRDGLLSGRGVLPATADFELGTGCNAGAWLRAWSNAIRRLTRDMVYSDPGYYTPMLGCFTNADYGWVADLNGFQPLCGLWTVFQQYSWAAWDGVAHVDGDVFRGSYQQLQALAGIFPPKPPKHSRQQLLRLRIELRADLARRRCRVAPYHGRGRYHRLCHHWLLYGASVNKQLRG